jgi:hypothetical protein
MAAVWLGHYNPPADGHTVLQAFSGTSILATWAIGMALGFGLMGYRRAAPAKTFVPGIAIVLLLNLAVLLASGVEMVSAAATSGQGWLAHLWGGTEESGQQASTPGAAQTGENASQGLPAGLVGLMNWVNSLPQLSDLNRQKAMSALFEITQGKDTPLAALMIQAMGSAGDPKSIEALAAVLRDESRSSQTRLQAAWAIWFIGGEAGRTVLQEVQASCKDRQLADSIQMLLDIMPPSPPPKPAEQPKS